MHSITLRSHVGKDGMLNLQLPGELSDTDLEIVIIVQPIDKPTPEQPSTHLNWPPSFFEETAGAWKGEPLVREDQGEYEVRDELV